MQVICEDICKGSGVSRSRNRESSTRGGLGRVQSDHSGICWRANLYSCPNLKQRDWLAYSPLVHQEILQGMADEG